MKLSTITVSALACLAMAAPVDKREARPVRWIPYQYNGETRYWDFELNLHRKLEQDRNREW